MAGHVASDSAWIIVELLMRRIEEIMDWEWVPLYFIAIKVLVLGTAMYFAVKSHYDGEKQEQEEERERQRRLDASRAPASNQ